MAPQSCEYFKRLEICALINEEWDSGKLMSKTESTFLEQGYAECVYASAASLFCSVSSAFFKKISDN